MAVACVHPALASFACFEWASVASTEIQLVQYLVATPCEPATELLAQALNVTNASCTNEANMIDFGAGCSASLQAMQAALDTNHSMVCDGGYIRGNQSKDCAAFSDDITRRLIKGPSSPETTPSAPSEHGRAPTGAGGDGADGGSGRAAVLNYFRNRNTAWYLAFTGAAVGAVVGAALLGVVMRKGVQRLRAPRAGPFYPARKRVKQGVYTGEDELGFSTEVIKEMDPHVPGAAAKGRAVRGSRASASDLRAPARTAGANVRYHHHDWCAGEPRGVHAQRKRLSSAGIAPVPGWESDTDQSLLLY